MEINFLNKTRVEEFVWIKTKMNNFGVDKEGFLALPLCTLNGEKGGWKHITMVHFGQENVLAF
jgi:hypothetical protein